MNDDAAEYFSTSYKGARARFLDAAKATNARVASYEQTGLRGVVGERLFVDVATVGAAQLDIAIKDRFGQPVIQREWFLVPLFVIDKAIEKIRDGTITGFTYDPKTARLVQRETGHTSPSDAV